MHNEEFWIAAQTNVPPIAWGMPGTGKTRSIEAFAKSIGVHCESISLSQYEPSDIGGYPSPKTVETTIMDGKKETKVVEEYTHFTKPEFIHNCEVKGTPEKPSILFLDELTTCQPGTQASALRLLTHQPRNTRVVCAANPPDVAANGYALEPPVTNRLYHHEWEIAPKEWLRSFMMDFPDSENSYPILPESWQSSVATARSFITAFLTDQPRAIQKDKFQQKDRSSNHGRAVAWNSMRSWTNASVLLGAAMSVGHQFDENGVSQVAGNLLRGTVGQGVETFINWRKNLKMLPPKEVFDLLKSGKFKKEHMPRKSDEALALLAYCLSDFVGTKTKQNFDISWKLIMAAIDYGHKDLAVATKDIIFHAQKDMKNYQAPSDAMAFMAQLFDKIHGQKR